MAKVGIKIRDARATDLEVVVDLWEMLAKHHTKLSSQFMLAEDSREKWAKYLARKHAEKSTKLIVAEERGEIIGFMLCLLSPNEPIYKERKLGVISDVFVKEERRQKGVAKMMLGFALRWFKKNKVKVVQTCVVYANLQARAIWNQLGFKPFCIYKRLDLEKMESR